MRFVEVSSIVLKNPFECQGIDKHLTGFATLRRPYDSCCLHLVHDFSGAVVANGITPLERRS